MSQKDSEWSRISSNLNRKEMKLLLGDKEILVTASMRGVVEGEQQEGLPTPNYLEKTLCMSIPYSGDLESATIRNSFSIGSLRPIKHLPAKLAPGAVLEARTKRIKENLLSRHNNVYQSKKSDLFNPVPYMSNEYDKSKKVLKLVEEDERNQLASISRKPFIVTAPPEKSKSSDIFIHHEYQTIPHLQSITRDSLNDSTKFLHGSFQSTCSKNRVSKQPSLLDIQHWLKQIYSIMAADWGHLKFSIQFTQQNELLLLFETVNLPPANALLNYMNHIAVHGVVASLGFTKRGDRWYTLEEDNRLVFSFFAPGHRRPPCTIKIAPSHQANKKNCMR